MIETIRQNFDLPINYWNDCEIDEQLPTGLGDKVTISAHSIRRLSGKHFPSRAIRPIGEAQEVDPNVDIVGDSNSEILCQVFIS